MQQNFSQQNASFKNSQLTINHLNHSTQYNLTVGKSALPRTICICVQHNKYLQVRLKFSGCEKYSISTIIQGTTSYKIPSPVTSAHVENSITNDCNVSWSYDTISNEIGRFIASLRKAFEIHLFFYPFQHKFTSLNSFLWSMLSFGLWAGSCNVRFAASMLEFNSHVE